VLQITDTKHRVKGAATDEVRKSKVQRFLHETNSWPKALWQSPKWQLIGMSLWYRSALWGHPLLTLTNNWTRGLQLADIPLFQSVT